MSPKGKLSQYVYYLEPMIRLLKYRSVDFKDVIFVNPGPIPNSFLDSEYKKYKNN